ncbi:hypothetical protein ACHAPT_007508 [Fusarium lateritium]
MPPSESPLSPSRFIYERRPFRSELGNEDMDSDGPPPSRDGPDAPQDHFRYFPAQRHDREQFANAIPPGAAPYARDIAPRERAVGLDDDGTMASLFINDNEPEHGAQALNIPEIRSAVTRYVHGICLGVSQDFIQQFRYNIERRRVEAQGPEPRRFADRIAGFDETARSLYRGAHATPSLMTNTTTICSILWARGNALQMLSPSSVFAAVEGMRGLNAAGEDVARIFDMASLWEDVDEMELRDVLRRGMEYCGRLEYMESHEDLYNMGYWLFGEPWVG